MRKLIIAGVVLLILGGLVALALLNLNRLINRNKDYLLAQAQQVLERKVSVEEIGVTLWGGIGVRLKNFALADDQGFSSGDFIRAADLQVNVKFLPLLWKELQVTRLILHKPMMTVIRDKRGRFNFASLGHPGKEEGKKRTESTAPPATTAALPLLVSLVDVADAEVHYLDKKDGVDLRASQLDLTVEDLGFDRPVSINMTAAVFAADKPNLKLTGRLGPLGKSTKDLSLSGDVKLEPVALTNLRHFAPLAGVLPSDLSADGPLSLSAHAEGTPENLTLAGALEATASTISLGDRFRKPQGVPLLLSTDARVTKKTVNLQKAKLQLHTLELTGSGEISQAETPSLRLTVDSNRTELAGWEKIIPLLQDYDLSGGLEVHARIQGKMGKGKPPKINGSLTLAGVRAALPSVPKPLTDLNANITFTGDQAELAETALRLGNSQIRMVAQVQKFTPPTLTYRLSAPELWLADLRAGDSAGKRAEVLREVKSEGRIGTENGSFSYQGKLSSTRGTISDIDYTDLQTAVSLADQVVTIENLRVQALDGSLQGSGRYDLREAAPRFTLAPRIQGVDLTQFFRSMLPAARQHIQGRVNLDLQLAGSGEKWEDIQPALQGKGQAEVVQGALLDVNIAEGVLSGVTGIPGLSVLVSPRVRSKYPEIFATQNTEFDQLQGSVTISNGKVHIDDLLIAAADWAARGKGWFTFDRTLDFRALLIMSQRLSDNLVDDVKEAKYIVNEQGRLEIPFALAGTLPRVKPKPDLAHVGRLLQRAALRRGAEELEKRVLKKILPPTGQPPEEAGQSSRVSPPVAPKQPEKSLEEELLRKGLERLFDR